MLLLLTCFYVKIPLHYLIYKQWIFFLLSAVVSVEATYSYYEKVSQELERIVHEVKEEDEELTDGEKLFLVQFIIVS